jgi:glycosyltransferase involved in cell wall biosynthesis
MRNNGDGVASLRPGTASGRRPTVLVLTTLGPNGMGGIDRLTDGIRRHCATAIPDLDLVFITTRGPGLLLLSPFYSLRAALLLVWYRMTRGRSVCHVNLSSRGSTFRKLALSGLARCLGHTTVIHLHGSRFREYFQSVGNLQRRAITRMFREAHTVVVLGRAWREFVLAAFGLDDSRVLVLPNATEARPVERAKENVPPLILFLGRVGARKGVPVLVAALAALAKTALPWKAEIAGDGDTAPYAEQVEAEGLGDRVAFPGWLAESEAHERLSRAAVLVLPSEAEGLPMSIIEAFAWGIPVIATPVGSIPDILQDGVQGLIVPVGDGAALAVALERLIGDDGLRHRLGANALDYHRANLEFGPFLNRLAACWRAAAPRL